MRLGLTLETNVYKSGVAYSSELVLPAEELELACFGFRCILLPSKGQLTDSI